MYQLLGKAKPHTFDVKLSTNSNFNIVCNIMIISMSKVLIVQNVRNFFTRGKLSCYVNKSTYSVSKKLYSIDSKNIYNLR